MPERRPRLSTATNVGGFAAALRLYADDIAEKFSLAINAQPEDTLKAPVGDLLRAFGNEGGQEVNWRTEVRPDDVEGRPDLGITADRLLCGHIELKAPEVSARAERLTGANRRQWQRFKDLPNLIYTNGSEWNLYQRGIHVSSVRIASDVSITGAEGLNDDAASRLTELLRQFVSWKPIVPTTSKGLAELLAPLTRLLRDEVRRLVEAEHDALTRLANEWRGLLFPDAGAAEFADAYAQTVTYALLLAQFEGAENLRPAQAVETLRPQHSLLAEALNLLEHQSVRVELEMPIELLQRVIGAIDNARLERRGDPWLYFYEDFLGAYDPKLRKDRGVYYTPVEVVQAQVNLVGDLLQHRFEKPLAFADEGVVVLDPAVGTGTYPLTVIDHAAAAVERQYGPAAVAERLRSLAQRLHAFEILVGPYSVAHLRLSQRLRDATHGRTDQEVHVYLADTLDSPYQPPEFQAGLLQQRLSDEHTRAQEVKRDVRVLVCLGNPPYDREERDIDDTAERRKGGWVRFGDPGDEASILDDFLRPVREAGLGVHLKNLYNDYVYFWRWALWKVFDSTQGAGIVSFITASSYLRGPGFAGMRQRMRETFDELWIIDLEGDSLGTRKSDNIFAIRTPVAIAVGARYGAPRTDLPARVHKAKFVGTDLEKLEQLADIRNFSDVDWRECATGWGAPFYPAGIGTYSNWPSLTDIFPWQHSGSQLKRSWPIAETPELLSARWDRFLSARPTARKALFRETRDRKVGSQYPNLFSRTLRDPTLASLDGDALQPSARRYAYRAFDRQWVLADARLGDFMRPELWRIHSQRQIYMTGLFTKVLGTGPSVVATEAVPDLDFFCGRGAKDVIPLWRDEDATQANLSRGLLDRLSSVFGRRAEAEDVFAYCYALLAQPAYAERFWDELELPPPRVPITKDAALFFRVADLGRRLLALHTYGERFSSVRGVRQGAARHTRPLPPEEYPESHRYDAQTSVLHVGTAQFAPVAPEVYRYSVSGFSVVKSWLDYRKRERAGRSSSELDSMRPDRWNFQEELLELLWLLEHTIELEPEGRMLFESVCASELFSYLELPLSSPDERAAPGATHSGPSVQGELL